ncbi:putative germin-like protein 2-3 [Capsicum annuum]|uniref:Germin-like protein 2-3 n=1 Tax=Capsicum annuum TaxID=4072 RepID=A0A2G2YP80_CAPAN|nr:putative germin-like protein 2-3 [Capsicum annuum]
MDKHFLLLNTVAVLSFHCVVLAFEPSPMQDFCVADPASTAKVNGLACKDPKSVSAEDFSSVAYIWLETHQTLLALRLVHYQHNVGYGNAVAIAALSSQNPGVISIANPVFVSEPAIETYILAKAFQVDKSVASLIQSKL